jgi:hypothetical protein
MAVKPHLQRVQAGVHLFNPERLKVIDIPDVEELKGTILYEASAAAHRRTTALASDEGDLVQTATATGKAIKTLLRSRKKATRGKSTDEVEKLIRAALNPDVAGLEERIAWNDREWAIYCKCSHNTVRKTGVFQELEQSRQAKKDQEKDEARNRQEYRRRDGRRSNGKREQDSG